VKPWTLPCLLVLMALGACGSAPPTRLHSLLPAPEARASETASLQDSPRWELLPVSVPAQLDQAPWVVRSADDTLQVLEHDRWVAPLADELHSALVWRIGNALAASGATARAAAPGLWRIRLDVQRFDALLGRFSRIEAQWSVQRSDAAAPAQRCRAIITEPAQAGLPAMAAAHRAALAQLADRVAASLRAAANASGGSGC
jgi:uncharacterized protein